jgi:hypothetical protein
MVMLAVVRAYLLQMWSSTSGSQFKPPRVRFKTFSQGNTAYNMSLYVLKIPATNYISRALTQVLGI